MAVRNAFLPGTTPAVLDHVPWTTFTEPEVAHTGYTEAEAKSRFGDGIVVSNWPMAEVDRARTDGDDTGFIKLIQGKNGAILGATVVNARAGEMIRSGTWPSANALESANWHAPYTSTQPTPWGICSYRPR
jgi:pyruvate/2-oxoglutarate dehydrogenase complex dihydrolipoamide dehydrogenase (E3) component